EDGYVFFQSRKGDMIKVSGANVAPVEVENALIALPGVTRAAVVGLPRAGSGNSTLVALAVVADPAGFDEAAARAVLKTKLSSFKVPRRVFAMTLEEIPLTGSGKIRKAEVATMLAARMAAEP